MRYLEFKNRIQDMPLFISQDIGLFKGDKQLARNQILRWQRKGLLIKLKKGIYILNKDDRRIMPSRFFVANQLYSPSYISLESALNFYGLIPECVRDVTSVSSRKTKKFCNEFGVFVYRYIQKGCLTGFNIAIGEAGLSYFIACPEKAVVDFFYFNLNSFKKDFLRVIEEGYRFQNGQGLKKDKILELAGLFKNKKLSSICKEFVCLLKRESG